MVVLCEHCRTRFQLDDYRIPAGGIRVRCSRCKHAFFLRPPPASSQPLPAPDSPSEKPPKPARPQRRPAAGKAPGAGRAAAPGGLDEAQAPAPASHGGDADPDESDWEFNTEFPVPEGEGAESVRGEPIRPEAEGAGPESARLSFDDVGDPENWDFLAEEDLHVPPGRTDRGERSPPEPKGDPTVPADAGELPPRAGPAPQQAPPTRSAPAGGHSPLGELLGWIATALLLVVTAQGSLLISAQRSPARGGADLAGLSVEEVRGRWVENALAGSLYVVSGRVRNTGNEPRSLESLLMVSALRESGAAIAGLRAPVGRALSPRRLRQDAPEQLREELGRSAVALALEPLAPGEALEFDALFETLPPEAQRLRVETAPLPPPTETAVRGAEPGDPGPSSAGGLRSSRTSSSPLEALPSSE